MTEKILFLYWIVQICLFVCFILNMSTIFFFFFFVYLFVCFVISFSFCLKDYAFVISYASIIHRLYELNIWWTVHLHVWFLIFLFRNGKRNLFYWLFFFLIIRMRICRDGSHFNGWICKLVWKQWVIISSSYKTI